MLEFSARSDARDVELGLELEDGETLAVLGPNGSGKSTMLELLAGLVRPDSGTAKLDGGILFDLGPGGSGAWVAPHKRSVSLLAQNAMLFPRMSVIDNVAFGPRSSGLRKRDARERAMHWLGEVDAAEFAGRKPAQLSGGQAQRIAIARALASQPKLLLLDEPMAALDVTVTPALRRLLRRVLTGQTAILVTHDVLDAYTLADRVVVMNAGRIIEVGPTREVFERPRSPFTAALVGLNLVTGTRSSGGMTTDDGMPLATSASDIVAGRPVAATLAPTKIALSIEDRAGRAGNSVGATVVDLELRGDLIRVNTDKLFADVSPAAVADLDLVAGTSVRATFDPSDLVLYDL